MSRTTHQPQTPLTGVPGLHPMWPCLLHPDLDPGFCSKAFNMADKPYSNPSVMLFQCLFDPIRFTQRINTSLFPNGLITRRSCFHDLDLQEDVGQQRLCELQQCQDILFIKATSSRFPLSSSVTQTNACRLRIFLFVSCLLVKESTGKFDEL